MGRARMFRVLLSVLMFSAFLLVALQASAQVIFEDHFDSPTLAPEWLISAGKGDYSLTANPGHLRYIIDAYQTARTASTVPDQYGNFYAKSLWLVRPFSGDRWVLKMAATYNLRPAQPTNCRNMPFLVREPGVDGTWTACAFRLVGAYDSNPSSNCLRLFTNDPADSTTSATFPNPNAPLPPERWYFEIWRDGDHILIGASNDGNDSTFEYQHEHTFPAGYLVNEHQDIEIQGNGWRGSNSPPGYVDFDFIRVEVIPEPCGLLALGSGLAGLAGLFCRRRPPSPRLRRTGRS